MFFKRRKKKHAEEAVEQEETVIFEDEPMETPAEIQVLVDDPCAVDNITRFAGNNGYQITSAPQGEDYLLILRK